MSSYELVIEIKDLCNQLIDNDLSINRVEGNVKVELIKEKLRELEVSIETSNVMLECESLMVEVAQLKEEIINLKEGDINRMMIHDRRKDFLQGLVYYLYERYMSPKDFTKYDVEQIAKCILLELNPTIGREIDPDIQRGLYENMRGTTFF